jgi:hypothetical protein
MPTFDITAPDGTHYEVTGPEGATEEQALQQVMAQHSQPAPQPAQQAAPDKSFGQGLISELQGLRQGIYDIPQSVMELGARGTDAIGLSHGAYDIIHQSNKEDAELMAPGINSGDGYAGAGRIMGQVAGTLPATQLKIGGAIASKLPTLAKVGSGIAQGATSAAATSASSDAPLLDQVGLGAGIGGAVPLLGPLLRGGGRLVSGALGETTGAGRTALSAAFQAGKAGGDTGKAFLGSMRGDIPWSQVVDDAKSALSNLRQQRNAAYRSGMADVSKDRAVLDFKPVDEAMGKAAGVKNFKGQDLSPKTADVRKEITDTIDEWKKLDPAEYHTPEGFDALKQKLGDIRDALPFNTPQRVVADNAYNAVRSAITKQAPGYDKVMGDYSKASEAISALQRELSLGPKGNPNTALRKLQSVMRDNANTSWGDRAKYAGTLSDAGATDLLPKLAGQSLSTPVPRGLTKYAEAAAALPAILHNPVSALALPLASPRLMGEAAYGLGAINRGATALGQSVPMTLPNLVPSLGVLAPRLAYGQ